MLLLLPPLAIAFNAILVAHTIYALAGTAMSSFFPVFSFYDTCGSIDASTRKRKNRADEPSPQEIRRPQPSQHQRPAKRHKTQGSVIVELAQIRRQREQLRRRREKHDKCRRAKIRPYTDWYTAFQQAVFADATAKMATDIAAWKGANEYESEGKDEGEGEGGDGSGYDPFSDREGGDEVENAGPSYENRARDIKREGEEALKDSELNPAPTDENATVEAPLPQPPKNADDSLRKIAMPKSRVVALKNTSVSA